MALEQRTSKMTDLTTNLLMVENRVEKDLEETKTFLVSMQLNEGSINVLH